MSVRRGHSFHGGSSSHGSQHGSHGSSEDELGYFNQRESLYSPRLSQMMNSGYSITEKTSPTTNESGCHRADHQNGYHSTNNNNNMDYHDEGSLVDSDEYVRSSFENLSVVHKVNHDNRGVNSVRRSHSDLSNFSKALINNRLKPNLFRKPLVGNVRPVTNAWGDRPGTTKLMRSKSDKLGKTGGSQYAKSEQVLRAVPHYTAYKELEAKQSNEPQVPVKVSDIIDSSPKYRGQPDEAGRLPGHSQYAPPKHSFLHEQFEEEEEYESSPETSVRESPEGSVNASQYSYSGRYRGESSGMIDNSKGHGELSPRMIENDASMDLCQSFQGPMDRYLQSPPPQQHQVFYSDHTGRLIKSPVQNTFLNKSGNYLTSTPVAKNSRPTNVQSVASPGPQESHSNIVNVSISQEKSSSTIKSPRSLLDRYIKTPLSQKDSVESDPFTESNDSSESQRSSRSERSSSTGNGPYSNTRSAYGPSTDSISSGSQGYSNGSGQRAKDTGTQESYRNNVQYNTSARTNIPQQSSNSAYNTSKGTTR